jgi:hypothetical protein
VRGCCVSLVQGCVEGRGFALETIAPVREAEPESKVGEHRGEVIESGNGASGRVQGSHLFGREDGHGEWRRTGLCRWCEWIFGIKR